MIAMIVRRLFQLPIILLVIYTTTLTLAWAIPGNPLDKPDGRRPAPEVVALASRIVSSKAVRQPVSVVARILELSETESRKNVVADRAGVHHSVVSKVLEAAETQRRSQLAVAS